MMKRLILVLGVVMSGWLGMAQTGEIKPVGAKILIAPNTPTFHFLPPDTTVGIDMGRYGHMELAGAKRFQYKINSLAASKENNFTKGDLTESIGGLQFSVVRQVIGGSTDLQLSSGFFIPTTIEQTNWNSIYNWDKDYGDLTNKPTIPAAQVSSDWNATMGVSMIFNKPTLFSGSYTDLTNKPSLFSGSYTDLTNKPTIPAAQVSSDWNATTGVPMILNKPALFSGSYTDLTNKPSLFSGSYTDLTSKPTIPAAQVSSDWNATTGVPMILNKPTLFSGSYTDLTNKPTIPAAQVSSDWNATTGVPMILNKPALFSGSYTDLTNKPSLFSGSYTDLTNKPTIPAAQVNSDWTAASGISMILNKPALFSGSYTDLTSKPTIPAAQVSSDWNAASGIAQILNKPTIPTQYFIGALPNNTTATAADYVPWFDTGSSNDYKMTIAQLATVLGTGGGGGDVYKSGTPANGQIAVWTNENTVYGSANYTYNGYDLTLKQSGNYTPLMKYIDGDFPLVNYYSYFENGVFYNKIYSEGTYTPLTLKTTGASTPGLVLQNIGAGTYEDVNGSLRYNGTDLVGKVGDTWKSLTSSFTRTELEAIIPIAPYSTNTTLNTDESGNMKRTVGTATTITLTNLVEGRTGNIEITYTGAAVVTFNVGTGKTLKMAANIYNTTTQVYQKSVKTQSTGTAVYSYYMSGTNVYFTGTQSWN